MAKIRKEQGDGAILLGSQIVPPLRPTITTGSLSLDAALGGGWATNHWAEIVGHECLCPGTKILCADLVWRPVEELYVGQEIVSFGEQLSGMGKGKTSHFEKARVTSLGVKRLPSFAIETILGTTRASAGHEWVALNRSNGSRQWCRTDELRVGDNIAALGMPWETDYSWEFYGGNNTVRVESIRPIGVREVITIGTSTKTLVADGLLSHNSAGKSFLVLKTIAANQRLDPNWTTLWVATEDFSETYAEMLGVDIDRVIVYNENIMERVYDKCIQFLQTKGVDCIVIDSLPFLVSGREDEGDMDETQPGYPALLTGKFFRKSMGSIKRRLDLAEERNCTGLIVNGWRDRFVKYGDPRITPGGKGKNFVFFQRVDLSRTEWITNTRSEPVGQTMKLKNIKNKYARPGLTGEVDAYVVDYRNHRAGTFDITKDIVSAAMSYEVFEKQGAHYFFGEEKWYGRPNVEKALKVDAKLRGRVKRAVLAAAASPLPPTEQARKKTVAKRPAKKSVGRPRAASVKKSRGPAAQRVRQRGEEV